MRQAQFRLVQAGDAAAPVEHHNSTIISNNRNNGSSCSTSATRLLTAILILVLRGSTESLQAGTVALVVAVREVETSHIHTSVKHDFEVLNIPASRTQSADDLGATGLLVCGTLHHVKSNEAAGKSRNIGCIGDHL
jgi:hypothetical protein